MNILFLFLIQFFTLTPHSDPFMYEYKGTKITVIPKSGYWEATASVPKSQKLQKYTIFIDFNKYPDIHRLQWNVDFKPNQTKAKILLHVRVKDYPIISGSNYVIWEDYPPKE
jgi:hypothetical protein